MSERTAIAPGLRLNTNRPSFFDPPGHRKHEAVCPGFIFNLIEFDKVKTLKTHLIFKMQ